MRIARSMLDQIVAQARDEAPNECCGVIGVRDGRAATLYKARNAAASPLRYVLDPRELFQIYEAIDKAGEDVGIIYHSHTRSDPEPSQTDINLAQYPDALYLILGVKDADHDDVRAWRIVDGKVSQAALEVEED
jgi:[CysO sulfur-carrier protein]-S-L-cysteine hydrolase